MLNISRYNLISINQSNREDRLKLRCLIDQPEEKHDFFFYMRPARDLYPPAFKEGEMGDNQAMVTFVYLPQLSSSSRKPGLQHWFMFTGNL